MRQLTIRSRREKEATSGRDLTLEELLDLYNSLIHDVEIAVTSKDKSKKKFDKDDEGKKPKKSDNKLIQTYKSLLTKKKKTKCILCSSEGHNVRSHHLDKDGSFTLEEIQATLSKSNRCLKCAAVIESDSGCSRGSCKNVTRPCWHCGSMDHHNLLCPTPKMTPPADASNVQEI